jgi:hypothetical protein
MKRGGHSGVLGKVGANWPDLKGSIWEQFDLAEINNKKLEICIK